MNIRKITEQANQVSELNDINVTEAVSLKDMGFKKWDYIVPSFRIGRLEGVSADQLTKMFGPPKKGSDDGKSTMEWGFQNRQGLIFTVYDYRNPPSSKSAPHNWSIGGVNKGHAASVQRAFKMMGVPGKMIKEETDPFMVGQTVSEWRDAGMEEVEIEENYKDTLKGVRSIKVVKPVDFAKNLVVGKTYVLMYDTSHMGEPMYRLSASGQKLSGRISGKKIAKALEGGMLVKEGVEAEGEDLQEDKIKFSRILQGVKDIQGPFTIVVMKPTGPGALMQKKVPGRAALPAHINHMLATDLKGKAWKAIAIEGSSGGVLNVLYPKDVMKESMEEMGEGFAQPTNDELRKSIKWLEGLMRDPAKMKKAGLDISDVKDNLRAAKDFLAFGDNVRKSMKKAGVKEGIEEETEEISESVAAVVGGALSTLLAGGFSFVALNFLFDNAFTPSEIKREWGIFMRRWKDKSAGGKMSGDQGAAMAKEMRALIAKLPKKNQSYLSGIVTRMQNSLKPNKDGKVDKEAAGKFLRVAKEKIAKTKTEGVEVDEASWGGGFQSSREAQSGVQASAKADAKRERMVLFSSIRAVMMGKMSKAEFKKKIGQSFEKISPLAKQKAMKQKGMKESVEIDENTYTTSMGTKVTHIDYGQMAQEQAKKILAKAKELGVKVMVQSSTSVAFVKEFTKGNRDAYFKAYRDCDTIRSMVKFTKRQNEWGCQGIGMLDCMEKGKIMIYKSGDGAAKLLDILYKSFRG